MVILLPFEGLLVQLGPPPLRPLPMRRQLVYQNLLVPTRDVVGEPVDGHLDRLMLLAGVTGPRILPATTTAMVESLAPLTTRCPRLGGAGLEPNNPVGQCPGDLVEQLLLGGRTPAREQPRHLVSGIGTMFRVRLGNQPMPGAIPHHPDFDDQPVDYLAPPSRSDRVTGLRPESAAVPALFTSPQPADGLDRTIRIRHPGSIPFQLLLK